jgi:DNA repair protein RecO (recombination protein O)
MIVETEAVVLRSMEYGDTSKIVTLYTRKFGKIKVIAKGARGAKNTFGSSLETMTISSVVVYKKEQRDLHLLSKSEIRTPLAKIQQDAEKMFTALAVLELVNMVMHDEEENEKLFLLLTDSLFAIDRSLGRPINVVIAFMMNMFDQFGYGIDLRRCSQCQREMEHHDLPFVSLRISDGTLVCSECSGGSTAVGKRLETGVRRSLHMLQHAATDSVTEISVDRSTINEMLSVVQLYMHYHHEGSRTLQSLSLLSSYSETQ